MNFSENNDQSLKKLLNTLNGWLIESYNRHKNSKWTGKHDEGTYLTSWREYFLFTKDKLVLDYGLNLLKKSQNWVDKKFYNGYHKFQEVHHGTEHFTIFMAWLLEIMPENEILKKQLIDASRNILNLNENCPKWYDKEKKRFLGTHLGTKNLSFFKRLKKGINIPINIVEHLRLVRMAWLGHAAGGPDELKNVIYDYSSEWADQILNNDDIPVYLDEEDKKNSLFKLALNTFIGAAPKDMNESTRSEIHIANGTPGLFLNLYEQTNEKIFLEAMEKIIIPVIDQLDSPYAHPIGEICWGLMQFKKNNRIEKKIQSIKKNLDEKWDIFNELNLGFNKKINWKESKFHNTVGIRKDMPEIILYDDKSNLIENLPSPSTLGLISKFQKEDKYSILGLEYSNAILKEALKTYPDGKVHGCGSGGVHAFCIGHGRNWGSGYISGILRFNLPKYDIEITLPEINLKTSAPKCRLE